MSARQQAFDHLDDLVPVSRRVADQMKDDEPKIAALKEPARPAASAVPASVLVVGTRVIIVMVAVASVVFHVFLSSLTSMFEEYF